MRFTGNNNCFQKGQNIQEKQNDECSTFVVQQCNYFT